METHGNSFDRLWYIRIISAAVLLALTLSAVLTRPFTLKEDTDISGIINISHIESGQTQKAAEEPSTDEIVSAEENPYETQEAVSEKSVSRSFETPGDILKSEEKYLAAFSDKEADGKVTEVFFRTSGATYTSDTLAVKNTTTKSPDYEKLLKEGPELNIEDKSEPVVLIYHTHTTESYLLSDNGVFYSEYKTRSTDPKLNMVRVGDEICRVLEENGIGFIHDTDIYDESYEGAYSRSRVKTEEYLKKYPSVQIAIDVHRDAIYYSDTQRAKPTAEIDGRKAAQLMIISGAEEGYITDYENWENNLRFSLCFQKTAEELYPGIMKPLYFCPRKYNMDLLPSSFLLEVGTDANTLEEAVYSGYLTGKILTEIIKEYEK